MYVSYIASSNNNNNNNCAQKCASMSSFQYCDCCARFSELSTYRGYISSQPLGVRLVVFHSCASMYMRVEQQRMGR